jgi:hypothetical protein
MEADEEIFADGANKEGYNYIDSDKAELESYASWDAEDSNSADVDDSDCDDDTGKESCGSRTKRRRRKGSCESEGAVRSLERIFRVRFRGWMIKDRPERLRGGNRCPCVPTRLFPRRARSFCLALRAVNILNDRPSTVGLTRWR